MIQITHSIKYFLHQCRQSPQSHICIPSYVRTKRYRVKVYYSQSQGIVEEKVKVFQNFVYGYLNITLNLYKISKHIGLNTEREKKVKIEPRCGRKG